MEETQVTQPTKAQWDEIAEKLDSLFSPVYLRCDGYLVATSLRRAGNRLVIHVAVNGWDFKGKWASIDGEMSEEAKRFWMPRKKAKMTQKYLKSWERLIGKRECRKRGYYDPYVVPMPIWNRPRPLINHLKKHNQSIEIIDYETYSRELEALRAKESLSE